MEKVKVLVSHKLRNNDISDDIICMAIQEAEQVIKNYCNICKVPHELAFTWANMAVDIVKSLNAEETGEPVNGGPASVSMGDTTVSISNTQSGTGHVVNLDNLIQNYQQQLQKFRRIKWAPF